MKVKTSNSGKVTIIDTTEYLSEDSTTITKGKFKFSETVSIDILRLKKTKEDVLISTVYSDHSSNDPVSILVNFDGVFDVVHIVLPTKEWFDDLLEKGTVGIYSYVYYCDNNTIYCYYNDKVTESDINTLLEINTDDTTVLLDSDTYVSIYYLRQCYIDLCLLIFNSRAFSACWSNSNIDGELTYKRDLAWMALNIIRYLVECEQLSEVARILELLEGCNGLCSGSNTSSTSGCGC